jgi:uncharacterized alkaline shock family protein YloU
MSDLNLEGMALADGVVETIISIAVQDIDGVASVGNANSPAGLLAAFQAKPATQGIEVMANDDDTVSVAIRIEVFYGHALPDVADKVRTAIADAVLTQIGVKVGSVDVYIDGIRFE